MSADTIELHLPHSCCVGVFAGSRLLSLCSYLCLVTGRSAASIVCQEVGFSDIDKSYESCCLVAWPVCASVLEEPLLYPEDGDGVFL